MAGQNEQKKQRISVFLYVPNLIGYLRIIFAVLSFYDIYESYWTFWIFYSLSATLDMADGFAARALNQTSKFGAVLDMITDRASTTCLIVVLSQFYPKYSLAFLFLIAIDIMSHFAHVYSSLSRGKGHKFTRPDQAYLIRLYYSNRYFLALLCGGNEGFFIMLYMMHFVQGPIIELGPLGSMTVSFALTFVLFMPIMAFKQFMNLIQLKQASVDLVELDENDRDLAEQAVEELKNQ